MTPINLTPLALGCGFLAALAAGCSHSSAGPFDPLPMHQLDLGRPRPGPAHFQPFGRSDPNDPWGAEGYREWRYIVIHHSASERGNAAAFDAAHRQRGWDELGYHFVIDNGDGGPDGNVEVGPRWRKQKWGVHCGGTPNNEYNNHGIGICLVGDFTNHLPTPAQLASLRRLVDYLSATYHIPPENVIGHRDGPGAQTECPGRTFYAYLNSNFRPALARSE